MKMKKGIWIILLIGLFITLVNLFPKSNQKKFTDKEKTMNQKDETYSFYKNENKERYQNFQEKNKNLKEIDIITRVNLNLDLPFYTNTKEARYLNTNQVLVNKYNYLSSDYVPNNLEEIKEYANGTRLLVRQAREKFENLCQDAKKENQNIRAISSYRSYDYQENLYNKYKEQDGIEKADTYSARPGFSEHQTGLVVDVDNIQKSFEDFGTTEEFQWMQKNAHKYGFILRYPKGKENITGYDYEAWHYRYVGEEIATAINEKNLTFDEYYARFIDK